MTQPRGMIADTFFMDKCELHDFAGQPESDQPKTVAAVVTGGATSLDSPMTDVERQICDQAWRDIHTKPLSTGQRLELHERDARLIALDLAIRTLETGAAKTEIIARAEAFLAFLRGDGGSAS